MILQSNSKAGFTLIELLVVIAIVGLLASVVLVGLNSTRTKARDARRVSDMNQMSKAMELFFNDFSSYPTNNTAIGTFGTLANCGPGTAGCVPYMVPKYLVAFPVAPKPADAPCSDSAYPFNDYRFEGTGTAGCPNCKAANYTITFCLADPVGSITTEGAHTLTSGGFR